LSYFFKEEEKRRKIANHVYISYWRVPNTYATVFIVIL